MRRIAALLALAAATPALAQEAPTLIGPSLHASAINASLRFYTEGLGMVVLTTIPRGKESEVFLGFSKDRPQPGLILLGPATGGAKIVQGNGLNRIVVRVPDLDALSGRLKKAGYAPTPIRDVIKGYRMMTASDPDGYTFELVERRTTPEPAHAPN